LVTATPGNVVDYNWVRQHILALPALYSLREVGYDPWHGTQLAVQLNEDAGRDDLCVEMRQGSRTMAGPTAQLGKLIEGGELVHDGNPVLRWNLLNAATKMVDAAGNYVLDKSSSRERIDGLIALVMAVGRAMVHAAPRRSRFEQEGEGVMML
jgi:phage terminase large subunit-like protein